MKRARNRKRTTQQRQRQQTDEQTSALVSFYAGALLKKTAKYRWQRTQLCPWSYPLRFCLQETLHVHFAYTSDAPITGSTAVAASIKCMCARMWATMAQSCPHYCDVDIVGAGGRAAISMHNGNMSWVRVVGVRVEVRGSGRALTTNAPIEDVVADCTSVALELGRLATLRRLLVLAAPVFGAELHRVRNFGVERVVVAGVDALLHACAIVVHVSENVTADHLRIYNARMANI
eukprot:IDg11439t1